jgi:hypothetical protein
MTSYLNDDEVTMYVERQVFDGLVDEVRGAVREFVFWKKGTKGSGCVFPEFSGPEDDPLAAYWSRSPDIHQLHLEINDHLRQGGYVLHLFHFKRDAEGLEFYISLPHYIELAGGDSDWFQFYIDVLPDDYSIEGVVWDASGNEHTRWKCELI